MKKIICLLICFVWVGIVLTDITHAQAKKSFTLTGTITDEKGETIPGANVFLKDRPGVGTAADIDGRFSINVSIGDIIVVTFVGYKNIEYLITKEEKDIKLSFAEGSIVMDEVVVTGMGSQRKISVVGAISSVNVAEIQTPATSLSNMLGGRVAGVISLQTSGEPGKNISEFWIRGIGTFGANSSALVLIDGLEGNLQSVDPADIESFSVLKDASATAVYGVRGANGVVLITTKRGTSGRLKLIVRGNFTLSNLNKMPDYLGAYDYAMLANEARAVRGDIPLYNSVAMNVIQNGLDPDMYPNVDWQKEIMRRQGFQQTYYASAQGGGEIARYFISLGMSNETAAYKSSQANVGYNTYNFRTNLDINLTKSTTVYFGMDGYLTNNKRPGESTTEYLWYAQSQLTPLTIPTKYSTGELPAYGTGANYSPYVMLNNTGMASNQTYTGKATLALAQDLSMLLDGLKIKVQGAYDNKTYFDERRYVLPDMYYATGRNVYGELMLVKRVNAKSAAYSDGQRQYRKYHLETTINYEHLFGTDHRTSALVYYYMSDQKDTRDTRSSGINPSMAAIPKRYQGLSSRITYGFRDTYMIDFNFGFTGSENFQPGNQFGFFPSIALGWVPTGYKWMRDRAEWLNFLKIRGSFGTVGNDKISNYRFPYLTLITENVGQGWGTSGNGITETSIGADNLAWEKALKADIGIEGRLFGESLTFVVDFFDDQRDGIFQQRTQIPGYAGLLAMPYGNVGKMRSWGSDGNVAYTYTINQDMSFTVRGNFTYARNQIQNWEQAKQKYQYQEISGWPQGIIRGYISTGLFRDAQDVASSPVQTFGGDFKCMPGDIKYKDVNGDGIIDKDDMVPLSNSTYPRLMYGFGGEFKYKQFTFGVLFKGTGGVDCYHVGYVYQDPFAGWQTNGMGYVPFYGKETGNVLSIVNDPKNRWTPASYSGDPATENPDARFPRLSYGKNENNTQLSTWWKSNARYLRLQEITLNYNWKREFLKKVGISSIDLQFVGSNLLVWDKIDLWDPEQSYQNGRSYPIPARYTLQFYVNF